LFPIQTLRLRDYRSYESLELDIGGQSLFIYGPNGAGKTNLLEAISILGPGRGLRGALFSDLLRKKDNGTDLPWAVSVTLNDGLSEQCLTTQSDPRDRSKRKISLDQEKIQPARLLSLLRLLWLTPMLDRLLIEGRSERLKFFDRLVFASHPSHASCLSAYEKALKERLRLLCTIGPPPPALWLSGLEEQMTLWAKKIIEARRQTLQSLQVSIDQRQSAFPKAGLILVDKSPFPHDDTITHYLLSGFEKSRSQDSVSKRTLFGPHRQDFRLIHLEKNQDGAQSSTGEQKALLINLFLAQASLLKSQTHLAPPILLFDEIAAHLDPQRRASLFDETHGLALQTLYTGTDRALFDGLLGRARGLCIQNAQDIVFTDEIEKIL
jgi:DNA replication and repair protein RecF